MGLAEIRAIKEMGRLPKIKKVYSIPKKSAKKIEQEKQFVKEDDILWKWFEERRKELTGCCKHCGGKTWTKEDDARIANMTREDIYQSKGQFYIHCIAHILPKAYFPSVATHPFNFIELCFWGNACHTNMDNKILDMTDMNCWDEIVMKFVRIYPAIDKYERKKIPSTLLQYLDAEL